MRRKGMSHYTRRGAAATQIAFNHGLEEMVRKHSTDLRPISAVFRPARLEFIHLCAGIPCIGVILPRMIMNPRRLGLERDY